METIGTRLRSARESRGLSIEDIAHETRIHANYIRGLEADDFSSFASTTYAKSFLTLYSRFLDVDAEEALHQFAGGDSISLGGTGYLENVTDTLGPSSSASVYSKPRSPRPARSGGPGLAPIFLGSFLLALIIAIPTLWYLGKDANSIEEAVEKGKEVVEKGKELAGAQLPGSSPGISPESAGKPGPPAPGPTPAVGSAKGENPATDPPKVALARPLSTFTGNNPSSPATGESPPTGVSGKGENPDPKKPANADTAAPTAQPKPTGPTARQTAPVNNQPLRAKPLIARPIVVPPEGVGNEPEPEADSATEEVETPPQSPGPTPEPATPEPAPQTSAPAPELAEEPQPRQPDARGNRFGFPAGSSPD